MSGAKRSGDLRLLLVAFGLAVAATGAILVFFGVTDSRDSAWVRSPSSRNIEGTTVYVELLRRLDLDADRLDAHLTDSVLAQLDVLLDLDPLFPPSKDEAVALEAWVAAGGVLVVSGDSLERLCGMPTIPSCRVPIRGRGHSGERPTGPLASDVKSIRWAGKCWFDSEELEQGFGDHDACAEPLDEGEPTHVGSLEILLRDELGTRIVGRRIGQGYLVAIADSSFAANGLIGEGDDMVLATNLASFARQRARGPRLRFDDTHYGLDATSEPTGWSVLGGQLFSTGPGRAVLVITLCVLLLLAFGGVQFGSRRGIAPVRRRTKAEYLVGVGATFRFHGAHRFALGVLHDWLRKQLLVHARAGSQVSDQRLAALLSQRTGEPAERFVAAFDLIQQALAASRLGEREFRRAVAAVAQVERLVADHVGPRGVEPWESKEK